MGIVAAVGLLVGTVGRGVGTLVGRAVGARDGGVNAMLCTLFTETPSPERYSAAASEPSCAPSSKESTIDSTAVSTDVASLRKVVRAMLISTETMIFVLSSSNERMAASSRLRPSWRKRRLCATFLL